MTQMNLLQKGSMLLRQGAEAAAGPDELGYRCLAPSETEQREANEAEGCRGGFGDEGEEGSLANSYRGHDIPIAGAETVIEIGAGGVLLRSCVEPSDLLPEFGRATQNVQKNVGSTRC